MRCDINKLFEDRWSSYGKNHYSEENKPFIKQVWIWGFSAGVDAAQQDQL